VRIQRLDLGRAAGQHGALVDVALVGDLAGVGARRLVEQHGPRGLCDEPPPSALSLRSASRTWHRLLGRRHPWRRGWEDQQADLVAVVAGDHRVLGTRAPAPTRTHPQGAHRHPGAGGELEVLGHAAVEGHARSGRAGSTRKPASPIL
jgi:hypothetical protein